MHRVLDTVFYGVEVVAAMSHIEKVLGSRAAIVVVWIHGSTEEETHAGCCKRNLKVTEVNVPDLDITNLPSFALSLY